MPSPFKFKDVEWSICLVYIIPLDGQQRLMLQVPNLVYRDDNIDQFIWVCFVMHSHNRDANISSIANSLWWKKASSL